ncbi:MAG: hypothetical protein NTV51_08455 [Verrucomicrobia bacterium]|nr:hypothetical protein [Verrucomicrobiota bacterium]
MHLRPLLALTCLATAAVFAAEPPKTPNIPAGPIAKKGELLFADDFQGATHDKRWHRVVDTFTFEKGALKGTQTRDKEIPAANGKPAVPAHAAVFGLELPTKDSIVEVKIRFAGATRMDVEFDDRKYTGSHYGHLCRAIVALNGVTLVDEREGSQNEAIKALRADPAKKAEVAKRMAGKSATFPGKYEAGRTYTFTVETVGDEMRASIDGQPVGYLKSPGIGHPTKSKIELGVSGKDGYFEDIKVWNAAPAK